MICVISDTHGDYSRFSHKRIRSLKKEDYLFIAGDFGFVWDGSEKEGAVLRKIGSKKFTTLFITGSHDNPELLEKYPETTLLGGRARALGGNLYMLMPGVFEIDGKSFIVCGGGQQEDPDSLNENPALARTLPGEGELEGFKELISQKGNKADFIITHEPPASIAEFLNTDRKVPIMNRLNVYFDELKGTAAFGMWLFGRLHRNKAVPPKYMAVFDEPYIID